MKMQLVDDWRNAPKWVSMWMPLLITLSTALYASWEPMRDVLSPTHYAIGTVVLATLSQLGRLIKQTK